MAPRHKKSLEEAFGEIIRSIREEHPGLSQERLGQESGSGRTYVSELERGMRNPSLRTLFRLSRRLGVAPSEVVRRLEKDLGPMHALDLD